MNEETVKLLMGKTEIKESVELTKKGIYPMVVDGFDMRDFYPVTDYATPKNGIAISASYRIPEGSKRAYYTGNPLQKVTHIILSNGVELPVIKTTSDVNYDDRSDDARDIDPVTGEEITDKDTIYTLFDGKTVSLMECIEQIEEMNPVRAVK